VLCTDVAGRTEKAWRDIAATSVTLLQDRGINIEAEPVIERLDELLTLLRPSEAPEEAPEAATPFSESSSRLSFSRDRPR
jgi:hypothetical protein